MIYAVENHRFSSYNGSRKYRYQGTALSSNTTNHFMFAHALRGLAAATVFLGAHLLGVFWFSSSAVCSLLGISTCDPITHIPLLAVYLQKIPVNYGHLGVSVFFLISGFVIPFSLLSLDRKQFLVARFFRIYPTYWFACACTLITLLVFTHNNLWFGLRAILLQFGLIRDLAWIPSLDGVSWTLEIEIKFYLLCALFRNIILSGNLKKMIFLSVLVGIIQIACSQTTYSPVTSLFKRELAVPLYGIAHGLGLSSLFIIYMLIGVFFNWHCRKLISNRALILLSLASFSWFTLQCYYSDFANQFPKGPINYFISLVIFSIAYIYRERIKVPKVLLWLGDISYPLYAIHPILGYGLLYWLVAVKGVPAWIALMSTITIVLLLATLLHHLIELPSNKFGKQLAKNLKSIIALSKLRIGQLQSR